VEEKVMMNWTRLAVIVVNFRKIFASSTAPKWLSQKPQFVELANEFLGSHGMEMIGEELSFLKGSTQEGCSQQW
jgi:hypothetical protein